jgi:hypothetical protein
MNKIVSRLVMGNNWHRGSKWAKTTRISTIPVIVYDERT